MGVALSKLGTWQQVVRVMNPKLLKQVCTCHMMYRICLFQQSDAVVLGVPLLLGDPVPPEICADPGQEV
eukprot:CAMPEP_0118939492 /NCGR_PEP_ID=MMETSP1169-20130426/29059_1 /TAXON_ID=36882 /ORGANISM="Pyramimonas obovata, Strain CCMP722" /LENGTH=68 /DNA_ID=CAMNT_0006883777 /DNA_START=118 /DNA_END=321 /DNA_ORIENTATION=-